MPNQDKDSKLVIGTIVIGLLGVGALTAFLATRRSKAPFSALGHAIVHIGEMLHNHGVEEPSSFEHVERKIHKHEGTVGEVLDWVAIGIDLWRKFKS